MNRRAFLAAGMGLAAGCGRSERPGDADLPPGARAVPGVFQDINPRWSHNARWIAFLRATPDRRLQLHVMDASRRRPQALLEPELVSPDRPYHSSLRRYVSPDSLAWSPDDRHLAFARIEWFTFRGGERLPGTGLWMLDLKTGTTTPLAIHKPQYKLDYYFYRYPQWSPDGKYVAFVGEGAEGERSIFVRALAGQMPQEVAPRADRYGNSDWPAWEPTRPATLWYRQGIRAAPHLPPIETLRRLHPGRADGSETGEAWRLTAPEYARTLPAALGEATPWGVAPVVPRMGHLAWSPDGERLAFSLTPDALDFDRYEIWTLGRDGTGARRVSPRDGRGYFAPAWLGKDRLAVLSPTREQYAVVALDASSERPRVHRLGSIPSADCDWSPDRRILAYAAAPTTGQAPPPETTLHFFETGQG